LWPTPLVDTSDERNAMGILTDDMRRMGDEQQLGFIAIVCPDGTPNLSPKGTTTAWNDEHLVFADICSPGTIANLRHNPVLEINVVDSLLRKGYRFKGTATILSEGPRFDASSIGGGVRLPSSTTSCW
jgi:predicted pyridoxine 5'-phosphate oxidase superfamily flavin-nucleotide-binding protein